MANLKKTCAAAVAVLGTCAGVLAGAPTSAQAQDPLVYMFQSAGSQQYLAAGDTTLTTRPDLGSRWELTRPSGAPEGVYQIRLQDPNYSRCLKAVAKDHVELADCAANPGKPQRWKVDLGPDRFTTIESRQYPGQVLTRMDESVDLMGFQATSSTQQWTAIAG